jgi:hypothetical protein
MTSPQTSGSVDVDQLLGHFVTSSSLFETSFYEVTLRVLFTQQYHILGWTQGHDTKCNSWSHNTVILKNFQVFRKRDWAMHHEIWRLCWHVETDYNLLETSWVVLLDAVCGMFLSCVIRKLLDFKFCSVAMNTVWPVHWLNCSKL